MSGDYIDPVRILAESACRVHLKAREGLGLPQQDVLLMIAPWRMVASRFLDMADGQFKVDELSAVAACMFAAHSESKATDAIFNDEADLAWEAVARHLCQWCNELAESSLRGIEGAEDAWRDWARVRGLQVVPGGA